MSGFKRRASVPFGPLMVSRPSSPGVTVTPAGTGIGRLPIRDMVSVLSSFLPDVAENFAADAVLARLAVGHDALRRGENGDTQAAQHAREFVFAAVDAQARLADALEIGH